MENGLIMENERVDDLNLGNLRLIQNPEQFCFGIDAVLLADFAAKSIKKGARVMDMCAGNGIITVLLSHKSAAKSITGLEIQKPVAEMAQRSIKLNALEKRANIVCGDLKDAAGLFGKSTFDNVVCNPPYKETGGGLISENESAAIARHEIMCSLEDVIASSAALLAPGGKLSMIHRPERLVDIIILMKKYKIEPSGCAPFIRPTKNRRLWSWSKARRADDQSCLISRLFMFMKRTENTRMRSILYMKEVVKHGKNFRKIISLPHADRQSG